MTLVISDGRHTFEVELDTDTEARVLAFAELTGCSVQDIVQCALTEQLPRVLAEERPGPEDAP